MARVTVGFARALARAAGLVLSEDGVLLEDGNVLRRLSLSDQKLKEGNYFDLVDWIFKRHGDRVGLVIAYAMTVQLDDLGALGLAVKTAPTLRDSITCIQRYFRVLTDTVAYRLDDEVEPPMFVLNRWTEPHPVLALRNECALAGFSQVFRRIAGSELSLAWVSFCHAEPKGTDRLSDFLGCPVRYGADRNAIAVPRDALEQPNQLGDAAVSKFLTAHLDAELGSLTTEHAFERSLAEHLSEALSNGIPKASAVARAVGMSERTLYRRLAESDLTYQAVLEKTQRSLAQSLLSDNSYSIAEVAFLSGFSEQSSFNRAFKRWVGQSPGAYRKSAQVA